MDELLPFCRNYEPQPPPPLDVHFKFARERGFAVCSDSAFQLGCAELAPSRANYCCPGWCVYGVTNAQTEGC